MDKKPHSRDKRVSSGSAGVGKGDRVDFGGSVGNGGRGSSGGRGQSGGGQRGVSAGGLGAAAGLLGAFSKLPKKAKKIIAIIVLIIVIIIAFKYCKSMNGGIGGGDVGDETEYESETADINVSDEARERYVKLKGNGEDTVTVMVYMCGTDLESKYGMATSDLKEMLKADLSDKINIIIETGGCKKWQTSAISNSVNQIYRVKDGQLKRLEADFGTSAMTDPANLTKFVNYCTDKYPANRNILIFWDHGGGSLSGYGYDEKNTSASSMTLTKINSALANVDTKFDVIGFDACLMATLETALVCNQYADYMIASEETEPGTGWYYTEWLNKLSENTSVPTVTLAKSLIDSYVKSCSGSKVTLSVVDLAELQGTVPTAFNKFSTSTTKLVEGDDYKKVSNARANARQFAASSKINQVDLIDLASKIGTSEAKKLAAALKGCVKYNGSTITNANGISIYFPYETTSDMNSAVSVYNSLGIDGEYVDCIKSFASLGVAGQASASTSLFPQLSSLSGGNLLGGVLDLVGGGSTGSGSSPITSLLGGLLGGGASSSASSGSSGLPIDLSTVTSLLSAFGGRSMPAELAWVDTELVSDSAEKVASNLIDPSRIKITEKNGKKVLSLTEKEWSLIQDAALNVYVKDENGFIDLGCDNVFELDGNDMILDYDGTWLTLDGNVVSYYITSDTEEADGSYTTTGYIPALLDGQPVNINVVFDKENPYGKVTGAEPIYKNGETDTSSKGDIAIEKGMKIQPVCDFYKKDGDEYKYQDSYKLGKEFAASSLELSNKLLEDAECSVCYRLTDIYGNVYYTPAFDYAS